MSDELERLEKMAGDLYNTADDLRDEADAMGREAADYEAQIRRLERRAEAAAT